MTQKADCEHCGAPLPLRNLDGSVKCEYCRGAYPADRVAVVSAKRWGEVDLGIGWVKGETMIPRIGSW